MIHELEDIQLKFFRLKHGGGVLKVHTQRIIDLWDSIGNWKVRSKSIQK
jgi:hypothetical protein